MDYLNQAIALMQRYSQLVAVISGILASWGLTFSLETMISPALAAWAQKLITFAVGFAISVVVSILVWRGLDPKDATSLQYGVSIMAAAIAPVLYIRLSQALAHFFPWLTAWASTPKGDPK